VNRIKTASWVSLTVASAAAVASFGLMETAQAAPTGGANQQCTSYCPPDGSVRQPSGNGNATNQPAAGTKGKADYKQPPGQAPDGTDHNKGYECDGNQGVGQSNPAHTGCLPPSPPPSP
jgi:hypothetical protein